MHPSQDFPFVRLLLAQQAAALAGPLRGAGHEVVQAADAAAVLQTLSDARPTLVLLAAADATTDAVARHWRACGRPRQVAWLLLLDADGAEAPDHDADDFVFAPWAAPEVLARIGRVVQRRFAAVPASGPTEFETLLLAAQRFARMGSWYYSPRTERVHWSDTTCELFGIAPGTFRGTLEHFFSFVLPADRPALQEAVHALSPSAPLLECEYRIRRPDGQVRWLRERGSIFDDGSGGHRGRVGMVLDVTEQKQVHAQLAESLGLTRIATRLARLGAWRLDLPDFRMTWSEENFAIHEVPPDRQPSMQEGLALFDPEHRAEVVRLVQDCALHGTSYEFEVPKVTARGRRIWVRSIGEAVRDAGGRIVRLQGAFQDITERKQAEEALRQQSALLQIAGRVARIGGWAVEWPQARVVCSEEARGVLELGCGQPRLRQLLRRLAPAGRPGLARAFLQCARSGTPFDLEARLAAGPAGPSWVRVIGEAERDAHGQVRRVQGAVQDISERVALQDRLRQAERLDSLGQLTGGVAHDFNNLLTVILGNAEMLNEALAPQPALQALADLTMQAAQRGADLTQRLLAFARRQPLAPQPVDLGGLARAIEPMLRGTLGDTIALSQEHAPQLWPALVDPVQLDNTLLNLCLNARDAMPRGGSLRIRTANVHRLAEGTAARADVVPGQYVMLAVADTGTGIAPQHAAHLFEPFFTTKARGKGTGLGLAMTYGFVKQSGGHIEVDSQPGRGTTVRMYLPRAVRGAQAPQPPAPRPALPRAGAGCTVLLVEDDAQVRRGAREQLLALGHQVLEARDGPEALAILERGTPVDLLFTDVVMPGMSGSELAAQALAWRPGLPVLYTSGYAQDAIVHDGRLDAGVQLLAKPYRRDELARRVQAALAREPVAADGAA